MTRRVIPDPLGKILFKVTRGLPAGVDKERLHLAMVWNDVVGEYIRKHSRIIRVDEQGVLYVAVDSMPWLQVLDDSRQILMDKLNGSKCNTKLIRDIRLLYEKPASNSPATPRIRRNSTVNGNSAHLSAMRKIVQELDDSALRDAILRAFQIYPDNVSDEE